MGFRVAALPYPEGAFLVRDFNSPAVVAQIASEAINEYCEKPYRTNIDSLDQLYKEEKDEKK